MKKKILTWLIIIVSVAAIYILLLLPTKYLFTLYIGTEVRLSIAISMVGGIVFGWPAAIGVFIGNLVYDFIYNFKPETAYLIILGSLFNALASLGVRYLFDLLDKRRNDYYIHDPRGLFSYFISVLVINLALSAIVSALLMAYSSVNYIEGWIMTFLNNINFSLLIGIPLIVYAPFILRQKQLSQSIKDRSFRKIILIAVITPLILIILTGLVYSTAGFTMVELWRRIFVYSAVTLIIVMTGFLIVSYYVRKDIADPLKKLAGDVDEDVTNKNELDILSSKLNFVANNQTKLKGNEFDLYIGLTSKDGKSFSYDEAKGIVDNICLNYVEGFVSSQSEGGYKGEETKYEEKVLIYKIFGATDEQIKNIVDDILSSLNQESILVEKNKINRWYISK